MISPETVSGLKKLCKAWTKDFSGKLCLSFLIIDIPLLTYAV